IDFLPMVMESPVALISCLRLPRMESYFRRWASVAGFVRSFTATNSIFGSSIAVLRTLGRMRPKPLIPTLIAIAFESPSRIPDARRTQLDAESAQRVLILV